MSREMRTAGILAAPATASDEMLSSDAPAPMTLSSPTSQRQPSPSILAGLRICFLAGTLGQGGAERQLFYLLRALKESGSNVTLLSLTRGEYWETSIREAGITIQFVGRYVSRLARLLHVLMTVRRLRPQVIQCQHFYTNIYGAVAGRCLGIPSVGAVRSNGLSELKSNGRILGRLSLGLPHRIAANSMSAIGNLHMLGFNPAKFLLIPNAVDTEWFQPAKKRQRTGNEFVILGVGSLEAVKRFDRLLEIAACLGAKTKRRVRVVIAGDGSQRDSIEVLAEQTRQRGVQVELVGRVTDSVGLFQSADVLALTSDREGTPNVVMEAMACGLPIVASKVGGVPELIKHADTGFLFEPEDTGTAVTALERIACEPDLAAEMGRRARTFIDDHHSAKLLPQILTELYESVLLRRASNS